MSKSKSLWSFVLFGITGIFALLMAACTSAPTQTLQSNDSSPVPPITNIAIPSETPSTAQAAPTVTAADDIYAFSDTFGDGFIARLPLTDTLTKEEIVKQLVTQWLDHYKLHSNTSQAAIDEYTVDTVSLMIAPSSYEIVAGVGFSIVPAQIPNAWASFTGDIQPNDRWWRLWATFGVFRDGDDFRLRLLAGWGT
jgi:hypothetical protein